MFIKPYMSNSKAAALLVLAMLLVPFMFTAGDALAQKSITIKLTPVDDAYVVSDFSDPADKSGVSKLNTGNYEFIKVWYSLGTIPQANEKVVSIGYIKFDLSDLKGKDILKANLKMQPYLVTLTESVRAVDIFPVSTNEWKESKITYSTAPSFGPDTIASTDISAANKWYGWDLTEFVKKNTGSAISFAVAFKTLYDKNQENVVFYSKDTYEGVNAPYLEIELVDTTDYTLQAIMGGVAAVAGAGIIGAIIKKKRKPLSKPPSTVTVKKEGTDSQQMISNVSEEISCKLCGKQLSKDFKVCPYCGYRV